MDNHELKILPEYFEQVIKGYKPFEVRKDDRDYKLWDCLVLREYENGEYTGNYTSKTITYILGREENEKQYVAEGYVILGIK